MIPSLAALEGLSRYLAASSAASTAPMLDEEQFCRAGVGVVPGPDSVEASVVPARKARRQLVLAAATSSGAPRSGDQSGGGKDESESGFHPDFLLFSGQKGPGSSARSPWVFTTR